MISIHLRIELPDFAAGAAISIVAAIEALGGVEVSRAGALIVSSSAPSLLAGGGSVIAVCLMLSGTAGNGSTPIWLASAAIDSVVLRVADVYA